MCPFACMNIFDQKKNKSYKKLKINKKKKLKK